MTSGRLRQLTGLLFTVVFVLIGLALLREGRTQLGALMLAFAAFRGGLVAAQYFQSQDEDRPPPPPK